LDCSRCSSVAAGPDIGGGKDAWNGSQDAIRDAAHRYGVEPGTDKAVVWRESRFNPNARGRAQEIGLMQIQEVAARNGQMQSTCQHSNTNMF